MNLWQRWLEWLDAPQFCSDCGRPISVRKTETFDSKTGATKNRWVWSCPKVYLTVTHNGIIRASQSGNSIHPYGQGRPRWFTEQAE